MSKESEKPPTPGGQFLVCQTQDGKLKIDVRFEGKTVWLAQQHMAERFQTTKQNIGQHLKRIVAEGELVQDSVANTTSSAPSPTGPRCRSITRAGFPSGPLQRTHQASPRIGGGDAESRDDRSGGYVSKCNRATQPNWAVCLPKPLQ